MDSHSSEHIIFLYALETGEKEPSFNKNPLVEEMFNRIISLFS